MTEMQVFKNSEFGELEITEIDGKPYFPATKCAEILGYSNPQEAIREHCTRVSETLTQVKSSNGVIQNRNVKYIPEGDLYRLIARSRLPEAERFERWVFDEVLPSIRKHGLYAVDEVLANPDVLIKALTELKQEREKRAIAEEENGKLRPKALFADAVAASDTCILVGELAKILKGNGIEIGQNRLFEQLREEGYLIKRKGTDYNMPSQMSMELGLFKIKESTIVHSDGHTTIQKTPKITGIGQRYFVNHFMCSKVSA